MRTSTLDKCCEIISGATPKTSVEKYWDGDIHWATPKDLSNLESHYLNDTPRKITKIGLDSCGASLLPSGSVLFSSRAPIGHVAINSVPMATNQGFKSFIPKDGIIDAKFLFHWLRANRSYLESLGNGATFKEVSKATVARIEIDLPPIVEQRRIATILDRADALRAKRREALAQLGTLKQSIFNEMFGDPISSCRGWSTVKLSEVTEIITGFAFKSEEYIDATELSIKLCRGTNVLPGRLDWNDLASWPISRLDEVAAFQLRAGDIVMAMDRPWISEGFKIAQISENDCPSLLVQRVARIRGLGNTNIDYIYNLLNHPRFTSHCRPTETTIPHISPKEIRSFSFCIPPVQLQEEFSRRVTYLNNLKIMQKKSLLELNSIFASLQHRAFRGEL